MQLSPTKRKAKATLEFITSSKRKKNAIKDQLNVELLQNLLEEFIYEGEDKLAEKYFEKFLDLFATSLVKIPFSALSLTPGDQELVGLTVAKNIFFPDLKPVIPSDGFIETVQKIQSYWNLRAGRRTLIDAYLLEGASLIGNPFLTVFTEHLVEAQIDNANLTGRLDYVTAFPVKQSSVKQHKNDLSDGIVTALKPFFTVVEAKKEETFGDAETQMLGEIKALSIENSGPANGVLTDGQRWRFYRVDPELKHTFFVSEKYLHGEQTGLILAILSSWMKGKIPTESQLEK